MKIKNLILGAGISGLSIANFLKNEDYLILEREDQVGGYCRSVKQDGFVWDYAGHFFHFSQPENKLFFEDVLSGNQIVSCKKNTKIYYGDRYIDYPFQCNIHQLPQQEFIDCLYDLYFKNNTSENYSTFKDMLYGKLGKSISEKFLIPYNEKLYACDMDMLDSSAMGRFFPNVTFEDVVRNFKKSEFESYNNTFIYPRDGAQSIIDFLGKQLDENKIYLNSVIKRIDIDEKVVTTNSCEYEYDNLISTIPFPKFLELACYCNESTLRSLTYNKVLVFNLGFDKPANDAKYHWVYIPDKTYNFYRIGFYNNIVPSDRLSMYIEIGFKYDESVDVEGEKTKTLSNLKRMGIIDNQKLVSYHYVVMDPAYVHVSQSSEALKQNVFPELEKKNVHFIGRYGRWTYCSMEDCFIQARQLARLLNERGK